MKVLLLHPEDVPWRGPWSDTRWDRVIDLGFAGAETYTEWSTRCGSPVYSIHEFAGEYRSYAWIKEVLDPGRDQLVDRMGLDWWEILAVLSYHELQALYLLQQLRRELGDNVEFQATRPGIVSDLLGSLTGVPIVTHKTAPTRFEKLARSLRSARQLRPGQLVEIASDKWDSSYSYRRLLARSGQAQSGNPVVLLPSAYSNVTRLLLAYASDLPERNFLLASTRRSGNSGQLPSNVKSTSLAAYAPPSRAPQAEECELIDKWLRFERTTLVQTDALRHAREAGIWRAFPEQLRRGIRLRNAWYALMNAEPVVAVFCGDDLNYSTRIPLILAHRMGLNAVYCCHGALDGGMLFKTPCADRYLVKGKMEKDYLLRCSSVDPKQVEVGAPSSYTKITPAERTAVTGDLIFFSQPYEILAGRTVEIYREVLPKLCAIALRTGRRLTIKLHPFESIRERKQLLASVLPKSEMSRVRVLAQAPLEKLLACAWCGVGVDSSVAAQCTLASVPYFLCGWLDYSGFGYGKQLARYGAGRILKNTEEVESIPEMVADWPDGESLAQSLCTAVQAKLLDGILFEGKAALKQCAS